MGNSYFNSIKNKFNEFFDKYIIKDKSTSYHDKFILEQTFLDKLITEISNDLGQDYTIDKKNAYNYIVDQKDLSKSLYLTYV